MSGAIIHPPKAIFLAVREQYVGICKAMRSPTAAAAILAYLEYHHDLRMEAFTEALIRYRADENAPAPHGMAWIYMPQPRIKSWSQGVFGETRIAQGVQDLREAGFIKTRQTDIPNDKTLEYLFCVKAVQKALYEWASGENAPAHIYKAARASNYGSASRNSTASNGGSSRNSTARKNPSRKSTASNGGSSRNSTAHITSSKNQEKKNKNQNKKKAAPSGAESASASDLETRIKGFIAIYQSIGKTAVADAYAKWNADARAIAEHKLAITTQEFAAFLDGVLKSEWYVKHKQMPSWETIGKNIVRWVTERRAAASSENETIPAGSTGIEIKPGQPYVRLLTGRNRWQQPAYVHVPIGDDGKPVIPEGLKYSSIHQQDSDDLWEQS